MEYTLVRGEIMPGHGVASGKCKDERYPEGTLHLQFPHFLERGLDLSPYYMGTINLDISPYSYQIIKPKYFFENIDWSEYIPPENFYFFDVSLQYKNKVYNGLVYMPDPETKKDHMQNPTILELILPQIESLSYGACVEISLRKDQLEIIDL
ncbi:MAG TPA: hypothetical protein ENH60_04945 [Pricia sp.]|uniref:Uncharacterized protein n=2 Tax=root TaxID=1 RepID=A0A831QUB1_9FLAO|nr:hypothetical protein [Pricia sp.]HEA23306.1 hypothetical protein [Pricia antarctica]